MMKRVQELVRANTVVERAREAVSMGWEATPLTAGLRISGYRDIEHKEDKATVSMSA